ncbi:MAG: AraC family transcriptional regulator [Clostridia bacterium]|nr:AraC family transcriptional regulator [Clostridia bacterium]
MNILIVDDEALAVQGILDGVNWDILGFDKVLTANSYTEAVNIIKNTYVDIMVSDIEMPGESGLKLIEYVNEHSQNTECIILTCHDEFDYARTAVGLNCLEYLLKPIRYPKLTEIILRAKEKAEARRQNEQMKQYGQQYIRSLSQETKGDTANALESAVAYIDAHLAEELSVRDLAAASYISADHLTRLFKKKFGMTVSEYIQDKRIRLAGELLCQGDATISMVANTVGFGNYSYFTEQFKKHFGVTPREYQKQARK